MNENQKKNTQKRKRKNEVDGGEFEIIKRINFDDNDFDDDIDTNKTTSDKSSKSSNIIKPFLKGIIDGKLTWYIRQYLDMAISSALFAMASIENIPIPSNSGTGKNRIGYKDITAAIPGTIYNMLRYNGFQFTNIGFYPKSVELYEPIWYTLNTKTNSLMLFINEPMINEFCTKNTNDDEFVIIEPAPIKLSEYNLQFDNLKQEKQKVLPAAIKLMILCDHVTQHILSELYNPNIPIAAKLHDHQYFRKHGTTLHSMFKLTEYGSKLPITNIHFNNSSNLLQTTNLITNQCASASALHYTNYLENLIN